MKYCKLGAPFICSEQTLNNYPDHNASSRVEKHKKCLVTSIQHIPASFKSMKNLNTGPFSLFFNGDKIFLNHAGVLKQNKFKQLEMGNRKQLVLYSIESSLTSMLKNNVQE